MWNGEEGAGGVLGGGSVVTVQMEWSWQLCCVHHRLWASPLPAVRDMQQGWGPHELQYHFLSASVALSPSPHFAFYLARDKLFLGLFQQLVC